MVESVWIGHAVFKSGSVENFMDSFDSSFSIRFVCKYSTPISSRCIMTV